MRGTRIGAVSGMIGGECMVKKLRPCCFNGGIVNVVLHSDEEKNDQTRIVA